MTTLILLLMLHGLFLTLVLAAGRRQGRGNLVLAALIFSVSLLLLQAYIAWTDVDGRWRALHGFFRPLWFTIGPLTFAYIERWCGRDRTKAVPWLAFPALLVAFSSLPFSEWPATARLAWMPAAAFDVTILITFTILTGACAAASLRAVRRLERTDAGSDDRTPPWHRGWLRWLMGGLVAYAILDFAAAVWLWAAGTYPPIVGLISLGILTALIYGTGLLVVLPDGLVARAPWPGRKYERSTLDDTGARRRAEVLAKLMDDERPWLDERLRLDDLAIRLGTSRHELSQVFNQHLGTGFHDYVNQHRVAEAKRLLLDAASRRSILDIGLAAGFGSSASFYRAFKKHVGMTPKDFLASTAGAAAERFEQRQTESA